MKAKVNKMTIALLVGSPIEQKTVAFVHESDTDLVSSFSPMLSVRAGASVMAELAAVRFCEVGSAMMTGAGGLPFEKIIHAVPPRWGEGSERGKLANCTFECLRLCENHLIKSIAFPPLATGALGYPLENCAKTMLTQIIDYTFEDLRALRTILVCLNDGRALEIFKRELSTQLEDLKTDGQGKVGV